MDRWKGELKVVDRVSLLPQGSYRAAGQTRRLQITLMPNRVQRDELNSADPDVSRHGLESIWCTRPAWCAQPG
jgi:hypothetical protein